MAHKSTPLLLTSPRPSATLLWPLRVIALLLVLQAALLALISWYYFTRVDWQALDMEVLAGSQTTSSLIIRPLTDALVFGGSFLPIALLLLLSAIGFALLRRAAWLLAMICEGGLLLVCLLIYFDGTLRLRQSNVLYLLMLLAVLLVLYLNSTDVRNAFDRRNQQSAEEWLDRLEFERAEGIHYLPLLHDPERPMTD